VARSDEPLPARHPTARDSRTAPGYRGPASARSSASPIASSTTGPRPSSSPRRCAVRGAPARSGCTPSTTSSSSRSSSACSTPGVSLQRIRAALEFVRDAGCPAHLTLLSDGTTGVRARRRPRRSSTSSPRAGGVRDRVDPLYESSRRRSPTCPARPRSRLATATSRPSSPSPSRPRPATRVG
jgi:hypothetical protein